MMACWLVASIALLGVLYGSLVPGWLRPRTGIDGHIEHALAYVVLGLSLLLFLAGPDDLLLMLAALVALAAVMELAQHFIPGRSCRFSHFLASCAGSVLSALAGAVLLPALSL